MYHKKSNVQDEKRYSLIVAPKTEIAKALGNVRKSKRNRASLLKELEMELGLSHDEVLQLEAGNFENFNKTSLYISKYFEFLKATVDNLYADGRYNVNIPKLKPSAKGGKHTHLMAIDDYTTRFADREQLINHIRTNKLTDADLSEFSNDDLWVLIEYPRFTNLLPMEIQYSDNTELIDFIRNNNYGSKFSPGNPYVEKVETEVKEVFASRGSTKNKTEPEFRYYVNHNSALSLKYYGQRVINVVKKWEREGKSDNAFIAPASNYTVIRGATIMHNFFNRDRDLIDYRWGNHYDPEENRKKPSVTNLKVMDKAYDVVPKKKEDNSIKAEVPKEDSLKEETGQLRLFDMSFDNHDDEFEDKNGPDKPKRSH